MAEYDRSATGPLPVDAGPRRAESIFDLSPEDFRASLGEMQALGRDTDALIRQYRARNSIFAPINNAAEAQAQGLADSGRRSVLGGLLSKPEGATGMDAIRGLEREGWRGLLGAGQQVGQAFDAPAAAYQGLIPESDRIAEAVNVAGVTMGAGGAATAPRGALRSGLAREVAESPAQGVARLLREGRASEVTDDMLARLSPNDNAELFRLYDEGATGMDLPMDAANRQYRASRDGFRIEPLGGRAADKTLYHQTPQDISAFELYRNADGPTMGHSGGGAIWANETPFNIPAAHNTLVEGSGDYVDGTSIMPIVARQGQRVGIDQKWDESYGINSQFPNVVTRAENERLRSEGFTHGSAGSETAILDPSNIRSRFARFDPRLSSNANLLAANASQSGGLLGAGLSEAQRQARDILDMRAAGRAGEVTDDMMSRADDQYMFDNTPLPMDESSRLARADVGGFDTGTPLYHGTADEYGINSFDVSKAGSVSQQPNERAIFATDSPDAASWFANYADPDGELTTYGGATMGTVMPVTRRGDYQTLDFRGQPYGNSRMERGLESARRAGADGVSVRGMRENLDGFNPIINQEAIFDPTNIRSRFARFDPEFSHLSNLSAANASPAAGLLAMQQEQDKPLPFMEMLRGLLR